MSPKLDSILSSSESNTIKKEKYTILFKNYKDQNNYTSLGNDAHELAKWYYRNGKSQETIIYTQLAIEARKKADPFISGDLKISYYNLGFFHKKNKEYFKSISAFKKMLAIQEKSPFNARAYANIADSYDILGDPFQAVENHLNAFLFFDPVKDKNRILDNHINIAVAYKAIRQPSSGREAIKHLLIADSLANLAKKPNLKAFHAIYQNLGIEYVEGSIKSDVDKAIFYLKKALAMAQDMSRDDYIGSLYYNLGIAYIEKDISVAKDYFSKSLQYIENDHYLIPSIYLGFGLTAYKEKKYAEAQTYYLQSLSSFFNQKNIESNWLPSKKQMVSIQNKDLLLELLKRKLHTALDQGSVEDKPGFFSYAIEVSKVSDELIDLMLEDNISYKSKLFWRDLASEIYILALEACFQISSKKDAFYLMEKNKALLLLQDLNSVKEELPEAILAKELTFKNSIASLEEKKQGLSEQQQDSIATLVFDKKTALVRFQDSIADDYPNHFLANKTPTLIPLSEIKPKQNEVIIQYTMAERVGYTTPYGYGMMISNTENQLFKLEGVGEILNNIKTLRKLLDQPFTSAEDITSYRKTSHDIYKSLFPEEIRAALKGKKVTIIPDHMLGMIPFEALVTDHDNSTYLIEDCEIDYAFSLTFQQQNAKISRKAAQDFLGIAPVNFSQGLTALQNSNKEITAANAFYSGNLLVDQDATKENFIQKIKDYKILHLATHADASDSIAPWIAFRNSKLTDLELNSLQSQAELVVLSACNTSLGKISRGEGILSLARGFFKSGANTVIPSLWSTNDKATASITADFYKNLSEGQTKSAALRTAKLNYLHNNTDAEASPHYWASMILIGDTGTLLPQSNNLWMLWIGLGIISMIIICVFLYKRKKD